MTKSLVETAVAADFASWRVEARALLLADVAPDSVMWRDAADTQQSLIGSMLGPSASATGYVENLAHRLSTADPVLRDGRLHVPKEFMRIAREVACYRDIARWDALYRVLWRLVHGERQLLDVATDPDIHRINTMARGVRRAVHKTHAFVRFRAVEVSANEHAESSARESAHGNAHGVFYVAWFEPPHPVVELAAPFFARRFPSMRWSVLTPDRCAHWDGAALTYSAGVSREHAPKDDSLEELWRTYYASIFNPARLALSAMRSEMPKHYWTGLPEASLIPSLTRDAPARVARMLAKLGEPAERLPDELRAPAREPNAVVPQRTPPRANGGTLHDLDVPGAWDPVHDPGAAEARVRAERASGGTHGLRVHDVEVRVGTASWTDPTLLQPGVFYPDGVATAEDRLRFYASRFSLVEVDSTYYAMPARSMAAAWAARSPDDFVFDIKAFSLMTGHAADTKRLPDWLRRALPRSVSSDTRVRTSALSTRLVDEVWARFLAALSPLRDAGKLGPILLQFPRWFMPTRESADVLRAARARLGSDAASVEFRNPAWLERRMAARTFALLERLALTYVVVDAPPGTGSSMPPTVQVTTPGFAMVRLHGRRTAAWEAKHAVVSERYRYLYDGEELRDWAARIGELARSTRAPAGIMRDGMPDMAKAKQGVHVVYNNCHANYGTTNASEITELLIEFDRERRLI